MSTRWTLWLLAGALMVLPLAAATAATGTAVPSLAVPGEVLTLSYVIETTALAEVGVMETATCTLTSPDGAESSCGETGALAGVRVQGGQRAFTWSMPAPALLGAYTVTFGTGGLLALAVPPDDATLAIAAFTVASPLNSTDLGGGAPSGTTTGDNGTGPPPSGPGPSPAGDDPAPGASPLRYLASLVMASGAVVASVLVTGRGGR